MTTCSVWRGILLSCFILVAALAAQQVTATITGTVTDPSGAVIPGATVRVQNVETGQVRSIVTDRAGSYTASQLPVGIYSVTAIARGFQQAAVQDVTLHVGDRRALNIRLQPGQVTQTITVTTTTTPVQTTSGAQEETITGTQVRQLQLNNRNFEQLVTLQPGVSSQLPDQVGFGLANTTAVSVNGSRTSANNWTVDGADINDTGSNSTLLNVPSIDAMQEFKIARSTYDAQYGRSGGGQVNVVTKSGTNEFHGSAYEFFRNDKLNANNFLLNAANQSRPAFRYNDWGYTIGGPIIKDKTFFFWSEEWRRTRTPTNFNATLPPAQELTGNFQGIATLNPADAPAGCVVGNTISPNCFSKNAVAFINNVYSKFKANAPNNTFISQAAAKNDFRQEIGRLDVHLGQNLQLFGRYMQDNVPTTEPGGLFAGEQLPGISSSETNAPGRNVVAHMTWTISPTVVNEAAFNYSWGAINSAGVGVVSHASAFTGLTTASFPFTDPYNRVPGVSFGGLISGIALPNAPYHERNIDKAVYDNMSAIAGNHTVRFGFTLSWLRKSENGPTATNGNFTFHDTGSVASGPSIPAFGNFLLGQAATFTQSSHDVIPDLHFLNTEAYIQDDWKVRPRLTLNLGMRYSLFPTPHDINNILTNFCFSCFNPVAAPPIDRATGQFLPEAGVTPATYINGIIIGGVKSPFKDRVNPNHYKYFAPRIGFSLDVFGDGKTALRGGYGMFFDRSLNGIWEQNQFVNPPVVQTIQISNPGNSNIFDNPSAGTQVVGLTPRSLHATGGSDWPVEYYQDWNVSLQREIVTNGRLEVAYVGSHGAHLLGITDLNQPFLATRMANPAVNVNAIRRFSGYQAINTIDNAFDSNYHSLQVSYDQRVTNGLTLGVAYTWERTLTNNTSDRSNYPQDAYNLRAEYGRASFSRDHVLVVNYVYDLPFLKNRTDWVGSVLGGWEVSGITLAETGLPLTPFQTNDPFNSSDFAAGQCVSPACGPGGIGIDQRQLVQPRPMQVTNPNNGPQTVGEWFNTGAFTPAVGTFGTAAPGVITGPGWFNWDIAALKNFRFERLNTQIRGEFFNAFNHTSFNGVRTTLGSSSFGRITSVHDPRIVQLAIKFVF